MKYVREFHGDDVISNRKTRDLTDRDYTTLQEHALYLHYKYVVRKGR